MAQQDNYIGIAMGLDVTDLKAGLQETKRAITTANKEFNNATAGMDDWKSSSEGLQAKLTQLNKTLDNQQRVVRGYQAELEKTEEKFGANSIQARTLRDRLLDAETAVKKTEKSIRYFNSELENVQSEAREASSATGKLASAMRDADTATVDLKGGFTILKGVMANLASTAITSMVSGLQNIVSESREFRREMAYLQSGAEATGASFDNAKENLREVTSITEDSGAAVEGLNNLMTAGFDGDGLDQITDQLLGASIKWKDTLKFEGLADGLQETMATGKAVGPFVELLERGGMVAEDFDEGLAKCNTEAEKQQYVLDTLNKLGLKEVKDNYVETNKTLVDGAKANFDYSESMSKVGEKAEPILTTVKQGWVDILNAFLDTESGMNLDGLAQSIKGAFQWFIDDVIPAIKKGIKFVVKNQDMILALIAGIGAGFVAWKAVSIINGIITAIRSAIVVTKAWTVATEGMTVAQKLLNLAMKANLIGIVITAIVALVAAFVVLWNKSDAFREFWINLWNKIKATAKVVVDWLVTAFRVTWDAIKLTWSSVVSFFQAIWNGIKAVFMGVVNFYATIYGTAWQVIKKIWSVAVAWFGNIWNGIKNVFSKVGSTIGGFFQSAWDSIVGIWSSAGSWFSDTIDDILGFFEDLPEKMLGIGEDMMNGLVDGVTGMANTVKDKVENAVESVVSGVKDFLGISSPSKMMRDEVGAMMGEGMGEGILASTKGVIKDARKASGMISKGLTSQLSDTAVGLSTGKAGSNVTNVTNNYSQVINAPKQPSRIELYRQTKNLLSYKGAY